MLVANIAYNNNIIKDFTDPNTGLDYNPNRANHWTGCVRNTAQVFANNEPVNVWYLKPFSGFDSSGNQKLMITKNVFAGNPNPKIIAGFSTSVRYEKFTLNINMGGSFGLSDI